MWMNIILGCLVSGVVRAGTLETELVYQATEDSFESNLSVSLYVGNGPGKEITGVSLEWDIERATLTVPSYEYSSYYQTSGLDVVYTPSESGRLQFSAPSAYNSIPTRISSFPFENHDRITYCPGYNRFEFDVDAAHCFADSFKTHDAFSCIDPFTCHIPVEFTRDNGTLYTCNARLAIAEKHIWAPYSAISVRIGSKTYAISENATNGGLSRTSYRHGNDCVIGTEITNIAWTWENDEIQVDNAHFYDPGVTSAWIVKTFIIVGMATAWFVLPHGEMWWHLELTAVCVLFGYNIYATIIHELPRYIIHSNPVLTPRLAMTLAWVVVVFHAWALLLLLFIKEKQRYIVLVSVMGLNVIIALLEGSKVEIMGINEMIVAGIIVFLIVQHMHQIRIDIFLMLSIFVAIVLIIAVVPFTEALGIFQNRPYTGSVFIMSLLVYGSVVYKYYIRET